MKGIEILFERAVRNRGRFEKSLKEISNVAFAKLRWANFVVCDYRDTGPSAFTLTINTYGETIVIDAIDFFVKFGDEKQVTREKVKKCMRYGN